VFGIIDKIISFLVGLLGRAGSGSEPKRVEEVVKKVEEAADDAAAQHDHDAENWWLDRGMD